MKNIQLIILLYIVSMLTVCCSEDFEENLNSENAQVTKLYAQIGDESESRTLYEYDEGGKLKVYWKDGDKIRARNTQTPSSYIDLTLSEGAGTKNAIFTNSTKTLSPETAYTVYYPYNTSYTNPKVETTQQQTKNGTLDHLARYNIMKATLASGSDKLYFKHQVAIMKVIVKIPDNDVSREIKSITLKGVSSGTYTLNFSNVTKCDNNQHLTAYVTVQGDSYTDPKSHLSVTLTVKLSSSNTKSYTYDYRNPSTKQVYEAGKMYKVNFAEKGLNLNGHEAIDLGLPSGTLWATSSISKYQWGRTTKTNSGWTYYLCQETDCGTDSDPLKKFVFPYNSTDGITATEYDAARKNWGGDWQMPTKEDFEELFKYCKVESRSKSSDISTAWMEIDYHKFTGPNGNTLDLSYRSRNNNGVFDIIFWTATASEEDPRLAWEYYSGKLQVDKRCTANYINPVIKRKQ